MPIQSDYDFLQIHQYFDGIVTVTAVHFPRNVVEVAAIDNSRQRKTTTCDVIRLFTDTAIPY